MEPKTSKSSAPPAAGAAVLESQSQAPAPLNQNPAPRNQDPSEPPRTVYLTTRHDDVLGPEGRFVDLTDSEAAAAPEGLLAEPTAEQLARRRS